MKLFSGSGYSRSIKGRKAKKQKKKKDQNLVDSAFGVNGIDPKLLGDKEELTKKEVSNELPEEGHDRKATPPPPIPDGNADPHKSRPERERTHAMGQLTDIAQQYATAIQKVPLDNMKQIHAYLEDLAGAEDVLAGTKSSIAKRLEEETPADRSIGETLAKQSNSGRQIAGVIANLAGLFKKKHSADFERYDQPRNEERKADYENNKD